MMDARIVNTMYGERIEIIPRDSEEFLKLKSIWDKCGLVKIGYCIHAGGKTQHAIENSDFCIKVIPK